MTVPIRTRNGQSEVADKAAYVYAPFAKERIVTKLKSLILTLGLGAAVGAVAVLMMPRTNPTRKLAAQAACKVEDAAHRLGNKLSNTINM